MFILNAQHPTVCGSVLKLFHTRAAAEKEATELLHIIGDDLVRWHERHEGEPHPKALVWHDMKARNDVPFVAMERFVVGLDSEDEDDQEWCVELIEKRPVDAASSSLDDRELGSVLAGLRALQNVQQHEALAPEIDDITTGGGMFNALDHDEIDELCDRLNRGGEG